MTEQKTNAAALVAAGKKTIAEIATEIGLTSRTIFAWKNDKEFLAEVKRVKNAWREKARSQGAADNDWRLRNANDLIKRLRGVILQRARDMKDVKRGGDTGMLVETFKMQSLGEGQGSAAKSEYAVDTALVETILAAQEHVAILQGQWKQKVEHSGEIALSSLMERIHAGRKRVAEEKARREAQGKEAACLTK